jgi:hypothetical protein
MAPLEHGRGHILSPRREDRIQERRQYLRKEAQTTRAPAPIGIETYHAFVS